MAKTLPFSVFSCGISDVGLVRQNNEDVYAEIPEYKMYLLADGMGGHSAGEVASREAVETICSALRKILKNQESYTLDEIKLFIKEAIAVANARIYKLGKSHSDLKGMGTTLCLLHCHLDKIILAHVGDSRIYRYRGEHLQLLTKDHSLLREMIDKGQMEENFYGQDFHYKNIITKAIGTEPQVDPTIEEKSLRHSDIYLLCSDGLTDLVTIEEMQEIFKGKPPLSKIAFDLVSLSKKKGAHDNITLLLVQII